MNTKKGQIIVKIEENSIAEEMGICPGDQLMEINGRWIEDVFDYRYEIKGEQADVLIKKENGEEWLLEIEKEYDEDLGIEFETDLMSDYKSCQNKCIFCFIDQMPEGMRQSLYFKDDDSRLSFLQGNYITLTNMKESEKKEGLDLGETLILSANMFRTGEKVFLDDMTQEQAEANLGVRICPVDSARKDFIQAVCDRNYHMDRVNDALGYVFMGNHDTK